MTQITFDEILSRLKDGDEDAKQELYKLALPYVAKLARRERQKSTDKDGLNTAFLMEAESDIAQDALLKLITGNSLASIESERQYLDLLRSAVKSVIFSNVRKFASTKKRDKSSSIIPPIEAFDLSDSSKLLSFEKALEKLNAEHPDISMCFEMKYFLSWSDDEIASKLQISKWLVQKNYRLAKVLLTDSLG